MFWQTAVFGIKCSRQMTDINTNCDRFYKSGHPTLKAQSDRCKKQPCCENQPLPLIGLPSYSYPNLPHSSCLHLTVVIIFRGGLFMVVVLITALHRILVPLEGGTGRDTFASGQELNHFLQYVLHPDSDDNG